MSNADEIPCELCHEPLGEWFYFVGTQISCETCYSAKIWGSKP
jgi:hypothetical protein